MPAIDAIRGVARSWASPQVMGVVVLFLVCLGLAGLVAAEISMPSLAAPDSPPPSARAKGLASEAPTPFSLPPVQSFAAVNDRPLFSQTRRPSPQGADDSLGPWSSFVLAGIIITPESREALILHGKPPTVVHLQEGQDVEGWLVTSILPDRVVFRGGTTEHELKLLDKPDKADPSAPKFPNVNLQQRPRPGQ